MGAGAAAAVAAAVEFKKREIIDRLRQQGATSPGTAVTLEALHESDDHFAFGGLRDTAVVREAGPGRWYLDEATLRILEDARARRRPILRIVAIILLVLLALLVVLGKRAAAT